MLAQLSIRNFALIEALTLEFERGFNVLTGETGAGKSILIDAIEAVLGARSGSELVRTGSERATIEAVFDVEPDCPAAALEWAEDGMLILGREISLGGRSTFRINGRMCTAATIRQVAAELIDIHGQHDHQSLLSPERHVDFLDNWAGGELLAHKRRTQELYGTLRDTRRELEALLTGERERAQRSDLYRFQLEEIDTAAPDADEETELAADRSRLGNAEKLFTSGTAARAALSDGDQSALDLISTAVHEIESIAALDPNAEPIRELLETAATAAGEAATELRTYLENIESNPERLEVVQERLETYRRLKRKYGDTVEEIQAYRERIARELDSLENSEERRSELDAECARLEGALDDCCRSLNDSRRKAAARFEQEIAGHLGDMGMTGTRFEVALEEPSPAAAAWERGLATVAGRGEFLISANPGEPVRPLARIASGGEMSRVMLALKTAMAGSHPVALIFDEIDSGVGGRTAEALGDKIGALSRTNQVLCVTHMPQVACRAARHFLVRKDVIQGNSNVSEDRTVVRVENLDADRERSGEARIDELARMLGGAKTTAAQHARELLAARS